MAKKKSYKDRILERASSEEKRNVTFRLPSELIEEFKESCEDNDLTMNRVIEEMIREYLEE